MQLKDDPGAMAALERVVDKAGLESLLTALATICADKAREALHVDEHREWLYAGCKLVAVAKGRGVLEVVR